MQVFVDEVSCIGCGKCVRACPGVFQIEVSPAWCALDLALCAL
jgi:ferredoxin